MLGEVGSTVRLFGLESVWAVWLALQAWKLDSTARAERVPVVVRVATVEDVLRGRLARGEISERELEDELYALRDS